MKRVYLIQRLLRPVTKEGDLSKLSEVFAFGGGFINGGLSKEAMELLSPIFSFDYMGAAEFEFGAVPKALSKIVEGKSKYKDYEVVLGGHKVYLYCDSSDHKEIERTLKDIYKDEYKVSLKEYPRFKQSLDEKEYHKDVIGWLELDNGFFFFKDKKAFDSLVGLVTGREK